MKYIYVIYVKSKSVEYTESFLTMEAAIIAAKG